MTRPRTPDLEALVVARSDATEGAVVLDLAAAGGGALPAVAPGSHVDVLLPSGLVRQYSIAGSPAPGRWRIAVLVEEGGRGSGWIARTAGEGSVLALAGPRNRFEFEPSAEAPVLLIAAGIGITPIAAMAEAAAGRGLDYRLVYQGRSRARMALLPDLEALHGARLEPRVTLEGTRLDLAELLDGAEPGAEVYACGPGGFLDELEALAAERGLALHLERFEARLAEPVWPGPFEVELALTGATVEVPPGRSILELAEEAGAFVLSSCTEGTCGTCETPVLEGEVDHRDAILTPAERARNDVMFVCVSRAACPRLVLEL